MANDWIPMRMDLLDDPAVVEMAASLGLDEYAVVGRLVKLWGWANRHLKDGRTNVRTHFVDSHVSAHGFAAAMSAVGWLELDSDVVTFPNFDRWNSQGAKVRIGESLRKKEKRAKNKGQNVSGKRPDVCPENVRTNDRKCPGPEKRREEKRREEELREEPRPDFVAAWNSLGKPFSKILGMTPAREKAFRARIKDRFWRENWETALAALPRSKFLRGETDRGSWIADADFFLKPDSVQKIIEGKYADGPAPKTKPVFKTHDDRVGEIMFPDSEAP